MAKVRVLFGIFTLMFVLALLAAVAFAQETTAAYRVRSRIRRCRRAQGPRRSNGHHAYRQQGIVTDSSGYYRFANLPPGATPSW